MKKGLIRNSEERFEVLVQVSPQSMFTELKDDHGIGKNLFGESWKGSVTQGFSYFGDIYLLWKSESMLKPYSGRYTIIATIFSGTIQLVVILLTALLSI